MAGNLHSDPLGDPGPYHISDGGSAEVMKESAFETDLFAGGGPVVTYALYSIAGLWPDKYPGKNGPAPVGNPQLLERACRSSRISH